METKVCPKCKVEKSEPEFYRNSSTKSGFQSWCAACAKEHKAPCVGRFPAHVGWKRCVKCLQEKPESDFNKHTGYVDGLHIHCSNCRKILRPYNPASRRKYGLMKKFGITMEGFAAMAERQENRCAICDETVESLHVDHCHVSGKVRGLLCQNCNHLLGKAKDNLDILERASDYLKAGGIL